MRTPTFPLRAVAALFLERQHLDRPRGRPLTAANLTRFAEDVGGIQLDSINVVDRAHHLTLWSRFGPYSRARLERLVYGDRLLFEYWAHAACLVPIAHFPQWRRAMLDYQVRHTGWSTFLKKHRSLCGEIEDAIRERGPLGNADFLRPGTRQRRPAGWWSWKPATHALHHLWMTGRLAVHSRRHFQKRFELSERLLAQALANPVSDHREFLRWHLRQSLRALGAATEQDMRMYLTFPRGPASERRRALGELLKRGDVVEVAVEGQRGRWFAAAVDLDRLAAAGRRRAASVGTTLLSPFDSFLWHRERTLRLFGFDYRIEVYTPGPKRVHGYYSLPILCDGYLIGRVDVKNHRGERHLEVRHGHLEPWLAAGKPPPVTRWSLPDRDAALAGVVEALGSLAEFCGAERVTLAKVTPRKLFGTMARSLATRTLSARAAEITEAVLEEA